MGYQLQYISTTNGAFDSVLAANITATSVVESKFLITSFYNGRPVYFGVDYADAFVRASEKDMCMYSLTQVNVSTYLTLNEEHTAYFSPTEYRWNGTKIADVTGTVSIPNSPRFRSQIRGNFYYFKITDNSVDLVNLVAWDEDGTLGIKDLVSGNFYTPSTGTWTAGPIAHVFEPSKSSLTFPASGGSLTFDVEAETTWTASTPTFATLSPSTGGTGTTTVTATCPSYTGTTKREETITFTDNDNYTFDVKIRQRALTNGISNLYLGDNQIPTANAIYLGDAGVNTIYLGEEIVYSSGPFVGLKARPLSLSFSNSNLTKEITIQSSENWTITDDSGGWLSYSTTTGSTGKTVVTVTASTTQANRTATITVTSANYSATISVSQQLIQYVDYVYVDARDNQYVFIDTGIYPTTATTFRVKLKVIEGNGGCVVGFAPPGGGTPTTSSSDSDDYRYINNNGEHSAWFDFNSGRIQNRYVETDANGMNDITFGNYYIQDNLTGSIVGTATTQSSMATTTVPIYLSISNRERMQSLEIYDGQTLVFNGHAAFIDGVYGIYDSVTGTLLQPYQQQYTVLGGYF